MRVLRSIAQSWLLTVLSLLAVGALSVTAVIAAEDGEKTWQGNWKNFRYKTTGPLKCVAIPRETGDWTARFEGTFMGDPFGYDVKFTANKLRDRVILKGTAVIDGDPYQWEGYLKGKMLFGRFRSQKGYFGEFSLTEK